MTDDADNVRAEGPHPGPGRAPHAAAPHGSGVGSSEPGGADEVAAAHDALTAWDQTPTRANASSLMP